jgi:uncharacterized protein (DUF2235 family)
MPTGTAAAAETIVLFSDGTGNSSAKLFKTNVWRMYQAVDLGPSRSGLPIQIAYYDNGIGTQSIKVLALLAGIFGIGLKANVLRLYRFACRNGTGDCQFFCFGFSRGAFTIRLVAAMLAQYGLVEYASEAELHARTRDTFRDFMRGNDPNVAWFVGRIGRKVRDWVLAVWRAMPFNRGFSGPPTYRPARVRFVGVWDTVAAYGGPIAEITRGIDDYLWPLTMTDSCLNTNVELARHALSIDDERDSFWPVLWDEVDWKQKAEAAYPGDAAEQAAFRARLKQVWFAGMHADVGGGYPDESLSYVSLVWMMNEAEAAGLRLLPEQKKMVFDLANSLGPIHNSRGGLGVYYRPQPRKIAAFLHPESGMDYEDATLNLRDPVLGELPKPPHGVLLGCRVHESVLARLVEGTDDYAPATFPAQVSLEPYSRGARRGGNPIVGAALMSRLTARDDDWYDRQERIWDFVLFRRIAYFLAVTVTVALVSLPLWVDSWPYPRRQDARAVMQRLTSWSEYVPVSWAQPWIRAFEVNWVIFLILLLAALAFSWLGGRLQGKAHTESLRLWRERIAGGALTLPLPGPLTRARDSKQYQRTLQVVKWRILPALAALFLVLVVLWLGVASATQVFWAFEEPRLCRGLHPPAKGGNRIYYQTTNPCAALATVKRGHRYEIAVQIVQPWTDAGLEVVPTGSRAGVHLQGIHVEGSRLKRFGQAVGIPYRRLVDGRYLQPIVKLRAYDNTAGIVPQTVVHLLNPVTNGDGTYTDQFDAPEDGELFFFVNDAAFLSEHDYFYANNHGSAWVTISDLTPGRRGRRPNGARTS